MSEDSLEDFLLEDYDYTYVSHSESKVPAGPKRLSAVYYSEQMSRSSFSVGKTRIRIGVVLSKRFSTFTVAFFQRGNDKFYLLYLPGRESGQ